MPTNLKAISGMQREVSGVYADFYLDLSAGSAYADVLAVSRPRHTGNVVILRWALHQLHAHTWLSEGHQHIRTGHTLHTTDPCADAGGHNVCVCRWRMHC